MAGKKIKKATLLFPREELEKILLDLISLEILEVSEPVFFEDDQALDPMIKTEVISIEELNANQDSLTLLSTEHTLYLTGWIWAKSEQALSDMVSKHICAWETALPTPDELDYAPIILKRPGFLYGLYRGHRDLFYPLGIKEDLEDAEDMEDMEDFDE